MNSAERTMDTTKGMTIVVIDDSAVTRSVVSRALGLSGLPIARILEAGDGESGLEILRKETVSLALVDLNMPKLGGMELLERVRADERLRRIPILVVSTEGSDTRIARIHSLCARFLRKPFHPEALVEEVRATLACARSTVDDARLYQVTAQVLDELCFLIPEEDDGSPLAEEDRVVTVRYAGPAKGHVSLLFAGVDLAALAGDMMGMDPDPALAGDAAAELTNVVCGHALPEFYGKEEVFRLAPPRPGLLSVADAPVAAEAVVRLRGGHIRVRLHGWIP